MNTTRGLRPRLSLRLRDRHDYPERTVVTQPSALGVTTFPFGQINYGIDTELQLRPAFTVFISPSP
jgi:hypothetical protein